MLIDAVDGRSQATDAPFNFFSAAIEATSQAPSSHVTLSSGDRYFKTILLTGSMVHTLDENRHLDAVLTRALAQMILLDIRENPLAELTPNTMREPCVVLTFDWHLPDV